MTLPTTWKLSWPLISYSKQNKDKTGTDLTLKFLNRRTKLDSENIVAELVHGFLIPETQKEVYRQQCKLIFSSLAFIS